MRNTIAQMVSDQQELARALQSVPEESRAADHDARVTATQALVFPLTATLERIHSFGNYTSMAGALASAAAQAFTMAEAYAKILAHTELALAAATAAPQALPAEAVESQAVRKLKDEVLANRQTIEALTSQLRTSITGNAKTAWTLAALRKNASEAVRALNASVSPPPEVKDDTFSSPLPVFKLDPPPTEGGRIIPHVDELDPEDPMQDTAPSGGDEDLDSKHSAKEDADTTVLSHSSKPAPGPCPPMQESLEESERVAATLVVLRTEIRQ